MSTRPTPKGALEAALGAQFRRVRRLKKISQGQLAKALGCSINTVRWHEAGARMLRSEDIVRAAAVIGVDSAELLRPDTQEGGAAC